MSPDGGPAPALIAALEERAQRHRVGFEGGAVAWRCFGEGVPLVLLHGGHGSWLHWACNIAALAEHHEVWVPDLPGYGASSTPARPTLDAIVEATSSTLDALVGAGTSIGLAGFSFGGLVAAHLALHRGRVTGLALLGPAGHGGPRRPRGALLSWREAYERQDAEALRDIMRHNLLMHMLHDPEAAGEAALAIHTAACIETRFRSKPISRSGGLAECLSRFDGSLFLVWGEHDVTVHPEQAGEALVAGRGNGRTLIVPGAGHWVQFERAGAVNRLLLDWFSGMERPLEAEV